MMCIDRLYQRRAASISALISSNVHSRPPLAMRSFLLRSRISHARRPSRMRFCGMNGELRSPMTNGIVHVLLDEPGREHHAVKMRIISPVTTKFSRRDFRRSVFHAIGAEAGCRYSSNLSHFKAVGKLKPTQG